MVLAERHGERHGRLRWRLRQVSAGGTASRTVISDGGSQEVFIGGTARGTVVLNGGEPDVNSSGTASGTIVSAGGAEVVYRKGKAIGAIISAGGAQYVSLGGSASGATVRSGGQQVILAGGSAGGTTVSNGGRQDVDLGGNASATTVQSGGVQFDYGQATGATVSGGAQYVYGSADGTMLSSGAQQFVYGVAVSTTLQSGAVQIVYGTAIGTTLAAGSQLVVSSGFSSFAIVPPSATELVWGTETSATVGSVQMLSSGGSAVGTLVNAGKTDVFSGATATSVTVTGAGGAPVRLARWLCLRDRRQQQRHPAGVPGRAGVGHPDLGRRLPAQLRQRVVRRHQRRRAGLCRERRRRHRHARAGRRHRAGAGRRHGVGERAVERHLPARLSARPAPPRSSWGAQQYVESGGTDTPAPSSRAGGVQQVFVGGVANGTTVSPGRRLSSSPFGSVCQRDDRAPAVHQMFMAAPIAGSTGVDSGAVQYIVAGGPAPRATTPRRAAPTRSTYGHGQRHDAGGHGHQYVYGSAVSTTVSVRGDPEHPSGRLGQRHHRVGRLPVRLRFGHQRHPDRCGAISSSSTVASPSARRCRVARCSICWRAARRAAPPCRAAACATITAAPPRRPSPGGLGYVFAGADRERHRGAERRNARDLCRRLGPTAGYGVERRPAVRPRQRPAA